MVGEGSERVGRGGLGVVALSVVLLQRQWSGFIACLTSQKWTLSINVSNFKFKEYQLNLASSPWCFCLQRPGCGFVRREGLGSFFGCLRIQGRWGWKGGLREVGWVVWLGGWWCGNVRVWWEGICEFSLDFDRVLVIRCLIFSFKALTVEAALVLISYPNLSVGTGDEAWYTYVLYDQSRHIKFVLLSNSRELSAFLHMGCHYLGFWKTNHSTQFYS